MGAALRWVARMLRVYWGPLVAIVIYVALAFAVTGQRYLDAVANMLRDPVWWAENTLGVVVFTVLVSWVINIAARNRERLERAPYEAWTLELRGLPSSPAQTRIYWEDMRKITDSEFEYWKFVKSAVSSYCRIRTATLAAAKTRWLTCDDQERRIVIDFSRMTDQDMASPAEWPVAASKTSQESPASDRSEIDESNQDEA